MDPLSITTGVIGLLSSLSTLSIKINEFRKDFKEATDEIRLLTIEINDLTTILHRLNEQRGSLSIPTNLSNDLVVVLQNLDIAVVEVELHLKRAQAKTLRGAYWAFSGKKECISLCRGIESYKSTLNITLTLSTVITGHDLEVKADQILSGIDDVKRKLTSTENNFILQRYLDDIAETVTEATTTRTAGRTELEFEQENPFDDQPNDGVTISDPSSNTEMRSSIKPNSSDNIKQHAEIPQRWLSTNRSSKFGIFSKIAPRAGKGTASRPQYPKAAANTLTPSNSNSSIITDQKPPRTLEEQGPTQEPELGTSKSATVCADLWKDTDMVPKYSIQLPKDFDTTDDEDILIASAGDWFAICSNNISNKGTESYGKLYIGQIGLDSSIMSIGLKSNILTLPTLDERTNRSVCSLKFHQDGRLFALLSCMSWSSIDFRLSEMQEFVVSWDFGSKIPMLNGVGQLLSGDSGETLSAFSRVSPAFDCDGRSLLSNDARFWAFVKRGDSQVSVFNLEKRAVILVIPGNYWPAAFSDSSDQLVVELRDGIFTSNIEIWNILSGTRMYSVGTRNWSDLGWAISDSANELVTFSRAGTGYDIQRQNLKNPDLSIHHSVKRFKLLKENDLSVDGSLVLLFRKDDNNIGVLMDARSGKVIGELSWPGKTDLPTPKPTSFYVLQSDGRRVFCVHEKTLKIWEPSKSKRHIM